MDRKKAIIGAATVAGSLLAASSAYALTGGIVANHGGDGAGRLNPVVDVAPTGGANPQAGDEAGHDELEHRDGDTGHGAGGPPEVEGRADDD